MKTTKQQSYLEEIKQEAYLHAIQDVTLSYFLFPYIYKLIIIFVNIYFYFFE